MSIAVNKEMIGHKSEETTEIYINEFGDDVLSKYRDLLIFNDALNIDKEEKNRPWE